jgi:hypothetical protein
MIVEIPFPSPQSFSEAPKGCGGQDSSFAVDTEWGDKFQMEFGPFIAV